jgi:hypothetical protein
VLAELFSAQPPSARSAPRNKAKLDSHAGSRTRPGDEGSTVSQSSISILDSWRERATSLFQFSGGIKSKTIQTSRPEEAEFS